MNFSLTLSSVRFCFPVSWWKLKKGMNSSSQNFLIAADFEQPSSKNFVPVRRRLNNWTFCFKKVLQLFSRKITKSKFLKIRFWLFVAARSNFGLVKIGLFFVLFSFLKDYNQNFCFCSKQFANLPEMIAVIFLLLQYIAKFWAKTREYLNDHREMVKLVTKLEEKLLCFIIIAFEKSK